MNGAPLTAALIRAGNLPAHEREQNEKSRTRIGRALYEVAFALTAWQPPENAGLKGENDA